MDWICEVMRDGKNKVQNLSTLCLLLRTTILLKILGVANVSKSEFTLRSWQRSSLDVTLRVISDKSSKGRIVIRGSMMLNTVVPDTYRRDCSICSGEDDRGKACLVVAARCERKKSARSLRRSEGRSKSRSEPV